MAHTATYEPIQELEVENYGCLRQAKFLLTPLHALIGPNASGKTTALRALRTISQFAAGTFGPHSRSDPKPFDPMLEAGTRLLMRYSDGLAYRIENQAAAGPVVESVLDGDNNVAKGRSREDWGKLGILFAPDSTVPPVAKLTKRVAAPTMVRFEPNALRRPSAQILATSPIAFIDESGAGLASVYQAINTRDVDAFVSIRDRVRELFPDIQSILVPTIADNKVALQARLSSGSIVQGAALSDGLLYFMAFAALQYLDSHLFLIDEPENGLHPSRVRDVVRILRVIAKTNQVLLATHSPFVINELAPNEVSVVTRGSEVGSKVTLIADVPGFDRAASIYQLGEFWVSYADGIAEEPLLTGVARS